MLVDVVAEHLVEQPVELAEVAEDDVAALVPGEAGRVDLRAGVAARDAGAFVDRPVVVAERAQLSSTGQPARAGPDDDDARCPVPPHGHRMLGRNPGRENPCDRSFPPEA